MKGINLPVRNSVSYLFNNLKTNSPTQSILTALQSITVYVREAFISLQRDIIPRVPTVIRRVS